MNFSAAQWASTERATSQIGTKQDGLLRRSLRARARPLRDDGEPDLAHRFLHSIAGSLGLLDLPFMSASKRFKLKLGSGLDIASRACAGLPDLTSQIRPPSAKVCQVLRGDLKAPALV